MEWNDVLRWTVGISCVAMLVRFARIPRLAIWPIIVCLAILLTMGALQVSDPAVAGWIPAGLCLLLLIVPGHLTVRAMRLAARQQFAPAARFMRAAAWLRPGQQIRRNIRLLDALDLAEQGQIDAATSNIERLTDSNTIAGRSAQSHLFRLRGQWAQMLEWAEKTFDDRDLRQQPAFLSNALRAMGETGQVERMLQTLDRFRDAFDSRAQPLARNSARMWSSAFAGRVDLLDAMYQGPSQNLPRPFQEFWIATAQFAAGQPDAARARLGAIDASFSPILRQEIAARLQNPPVVPVLSDNARQVLHGLELDMEHDRKYGAALGQTQRPRVTHILIALNVAAFAMECLNGGATDPATLYRLGAMAPIAVTAGQYWRLFTANFLHFGTAHLVLNMVALLILGPFAEATFGALAYLLLYLFTGTVAMSAVWQLQMRHMGDFDQTVGASGAIMGVLGAGIAILVRGLIVERARIAGRRLLLMLFIVVSQIVFDAMTPQVSGTAHIVGLCTGFIAGCILPRRRGVAPVKPQT